MDYFDRVVGVATLALGAAVLSACYSPTNPPPPPALAAEVTPGVVAPAPAAVAVAPSGVPVYPAGYPTYGSTVPVAPPPSYAGTSRVVAPYAPPPPRVENPPPAPAPLAVWQSGRWSWDGSQFVWVAGHYVMRPSAAAKWRPGYWQQGPAGWTWIDGSWS